VGTFDKSKELTWSGFASGKIALTAMQIGGTKFWPGGKHMVMTVQARDERVLNSGETVKTHFNSF
jgi:hypothetical protein